MVIQEGAAGMEPLLSRRASVAVSFVLALLCSGGLLCIVLQPQGNEPLVRTLPPKVESSLAVDSGPFSSVLLYLL